MHFSFVFTIAAIQLVTVFGVPLGPLRGRAVDHQFDLAQITGRQNRGFNRKPTAASVQTAANNFAGDVATVSNSLNNLNSATSTNQRVQLATAGFKAESDEDAQRSVLFAAGNNQAANSKIVQFTPAILNGLKSIMRNPTTANTETQVKTMETARNANILPSITQLTNSAYQATSVNAQAKTFAKTTGSQKAQAGGNTGNTGNTGNIGNAGNAGTRKGGKNNSVDTDAEETATTDEEEAEDDE